MDIDIIPLTGDREWSYGGWRITKEEPVGDRKPEYALHSPNAEVPNEGTPRYFQTQEETLRHLEAEVNFQAELVLESPAMRTMEMEGSAKLTKIYYMRRVPGASGDAHCRILEAPGRRSELLEPRNDLYNHSPDGIEWGYAGSGPAQLALGILADALESDRLAIRLHQQFKFDWVAPWHRTQEWMVSQLHVVCWTLEHVLARAPVDHAPA